jgi:hypothetical protein
MEVAMRWWMIPAVVSLLALPALACGGGTATATIRRATAAPTVAPSPTAPPAIGRVGDTVTHRGVALTLHEVYDPATPRIARPRTGMRYVALDITIRNVDTTAHPYNPLYAKVKLADDREGEPAIGETQPALQSGNLAPGEAVRGWVTFSVPADGQLTALVYEPIDLSGVRIVFALR